MGRRQTQYGFTLVEISIVLLIVGLLTRSLLMPITMAQQRKQFDLTRSELQLVKDSLHAHLIAHGYLPCPIMETVADLASGGDKRGVKCEVGQGSVPAVVLGLSGAIDSHGALLDVWSRPYRYAVSLSNHSSKGNQRFPDWTTPGEASNVGLRYLSSSLVLCVEPSRAACAKRNVRADNLTFVVLSLGQDVSTAGAQSENQDGDETFLISPLSIRSDSPFDDQIVWSSTHDILYWMLRAGWLP
ncbi:MAG: prepilin-type N-terminal cleavage/methylation domain-containing protein [Granulosicoccus sp.]|jgi:prepilin-type N-terminal cleavage/methylation domain-containing protein